MDARAFVAGATGYTGQAVVARLRARGVPTVAHVRPDSASRAAWVERFEGLGASVDPHAWTPEAMASAIESASPTAVFALLGTTAKRAATEGMDARQGYEAIDYGLTKMLLDACAQAAPRARFVYLSSLGVSPSTQNPYLRARARIEQALREGEQPYTIARPSFITGPDRAESRPAERVAATVADAALTVLGWVGAATVRDKYSSMDAETLACALVRAALAPGDANAVLEADALSSRARARCP